MKTEAPLISILLAVYNPQMDWLKLLLDSLNSQTYSNLQLNIRDDCSSDVLFEDIQTLVRRCITAFPYTIKRNKKNLGSNLTFEYLTQEATGEYYAYCDQDDIWHPKKLDNLQAVLKQKNATMVYSDMSVIDRNGDPLADSLRVIRPRLQYIYGNSQAERYFFRNCTAGCSMLVREDCAKDAIPFPTKTVWDHWVAIVAAHQGEVVFVDAPLVSYRQHGGNQTGVLNGVFSKEDYYRNRVEPLSERLALYEQLAEPSPELKQFVAARLKKKSADIWKYRYFSPYDARFEIIMRFFPESLFEKFVRRVRHS